MQQGAALMRGRGPFPSHAVLAPREREGGLEGVGGHPLEAKGPLPEARGRRESNNKEKITKKGNSRAGRGCEKGSIDKSWGSI